jgi:CSLREA domain-containing protein
MKSLSALRLVNQVISSVRAPARMVSANPLPRERNPRQFLCRTILLLFLALGVSTSVASRATAAPTAPTFTVNSIADAPGGGDLTNGVCETLPGNGICTLRAAIMKANHFAGGGVTINIPAGTYGLTIVPSGLDDETTGNLNLTANMTIVGAGATSTIIDANQIDNVFSVEGGSFTVGISNVTIRNGKTPYDGGGIVSSADLTLNNSIVSNNSTTGSGGGIFVGTTLTLNNSTVSNNSAFDGGGIYNDNYTLTVKSSTISNNSASGRGGGMFNDTGTVVLNNSTVSNNSAVGSGGGILTGDPTSVYYSTIAGNLADSNSTGAGTGGGIYTYVAVTMKGTLLGQNYAGISANDCVGSGAGTIASQDYNLIEFAGGCTITGVTTHNITFVEPFIDSLKNNGGPTPTRALFSVSPAIDAIPTAQCTDQFGAALTVDQRGFSRPSGSACDIGAYEGSIPLVILGSNFILNGDGEGSAGSPTGALVGTPYWTCCLAVVPYGAAGGFPSATDPGPANRGLNFFAGGNTSVQSISQFRGVQAISPAIDAGKIHLKISSNDDYFGGFANQDDYASLRIQYLDGSGSIISTLLIDGPTASGRGNQTGLFPSGVLTDLVPVGTRSIKSILEMTRMSNGGTYNDGYADDLSFVLQPPSIYLPLIRR